MNGLRTIILVAVAFLGVFAAAWIEWPRRWLGAQFDLLPPLVVFAALTANLASLTVVCVAGGLFVDALSANPLGVSVLPLFVTGLVLHRHHEVVLRDLPYAQVVLGVLAGAAIPLLKVLLLLSLGEPLILGWGSLWQLLVVCLWSAALTPAVFAGLEALIRRLSYPPAGEPSFRLDREIRRGRY